MDIFDNTILCKNCDKKMQKVVVQREGFSIRAVQCLECSNRILHPEDLRDYEDFKKMKDKKFQVKLRFVGNSYAVSIPKEIINFLNEQVKQTNKMVNMSIEGINHLSLHF